MTETTKLFLKINAAEKILLVSHRHPDADTLGGAGAFCFYLSEQLKKSVHLFCVDILPKSLDFLGLSKFVLTADNLNLRTFDLIVCVDSADLSQTGLAEQILTERDSLFIVDIDHHQTNTHYADINIVESCGATSEIIFKLLKLNSALFTKEISTCLLAGIISDTTYFTNAGTTKDSMAIASELLKNNANIKQIIQNTWRKNNPEALKFWGKILSQLHFNEQTRTVTAAITKDDDIAPEVFEGLANFLTTLYEADIIMVMRETADGFVKCSLRTTRDNIDVSRIAQNFGGGGHAKAAGYTVKGRLEKTKNGWEIK